MSVTVPPDFPAIPADGDAPYFVTGGTMEPKAASYVEREADHELYDAMLRGEFCYVLTSRQMGKSSLFSRAAYRLRQQSIRVSFFDLSSIGTNVTVGQWFDGMLERIGADFDLEDEIDEFREQNKNLGPHQTWLEVLRRVLLKEIPGRITIIVDEIDLVRSLAFPTDEFFIGIRELYNRRSQDPELKRLSFCLLGVASPADLITNKEVTPFNIGRRIELRDFTEQEALKLADGIADVPRPQAEALVRRVFHWTCGQPYLTQRICEAVAAQPDARDSAAVDRIASELFLTQRARETEPNLTFIRDRILSERRNGRDSQSFENLLQLYRRIWRGRRIEDSEVASEVTRLKLSGLVRGEGGRLVVKNPIYRANFDQRWVREQLPRNWARVAARAAYFATGVLLFACLPLAIWAWLERDKAMQKGKAAEEEAAAAIAARTDADRERELARQAADAAKQAEAKAAAKATQAEESDKARAKAVAKLYHKEITGLWKNGRRFVAATLLELYATDPKKEANLTAEQLQLPDVAQALGVKRKRATADKQETSPDGWLPGPERATWLEPAGTFQLSKEGGRVERIIPWPNGPGMLFLRAGTEYDTDLSLFAWDLSSKPASAAPKLPTISFSSGSPVDVESPHFAVVRTFTLNGDESRMLLVNMSGTCQLWDLAPEPRAIDHHLPSGVRVAAFAGNSLVLATVDGGLQFQPDPAVEGARVLREPTSSDTWTSLAISPDARRFLTGETDGSVAEWDLTEAKPTGRKWKVAGRPLVLAFSPDGSRFLIATFEGVVEQHDVETGDKLSTFTIATKVESAVYSPDGNRIAIGDQDGQATVREARQPATVLLSATIADAVTLRKSKGSTAIEDRLRLRMETGFSPDGRFLFAGNRWDSFSVWDMTSRQKVAASATAKGWAFLVSRRTGRIYHAGSGDIGIFEFDQTKLRRLTAKPGRTVERDLPMVEVAELQAVAACPPLGIVAVAKDDFIEIAPPSGSAADSDIARTSKLLLMRADAMESLQTLDGEEIGAWQQELDARTLARIPPAKMPPKPKTKPRGRGTSTSAEQPAATHSVIKTLAFSHDGRYLAAGFDNGDVALLEADPLSKSPAVYQGRWREPLLKGKSVTYLAFTGEGARLIAGSDESCMFFRTRDATTERLWAKAKGPVEAAPDGYDASARSLDGKQWGINFWAPGEMIDSGAQPTAFAWSPDQAWCVAGLEDGSISLSHGGTLIETIPAFSKPITAVGFFPDGSGVFASDSSNMLRAWRLSRKAPSPLVLPGSAPQDAPHRWQVSVDDLTRLRADPQPSGDGGTLACDARLAEAIQESWRISARIVGWYLHFPKGPTPSEVRASIEPVPGLLSELRGANRDLRHLEATKSLADLFARSNPPDAEALKAIRNLPTAQRWLLLRERITDWAPQVAEKEAAGLWLAYANSINDRLESTWERATGKDSSDAPDTFDRKALPAVWHAELDNGIAAARKAFPADSAPNGFTRRQLMFLFRFAELKPLAAKARQLAELSDEAEKALRDASTTAKRREAAKLYDEAVRKGCPLSFSLVTRSGVNLRRLRNLVRAEEQFKLAESLADTDYDRADLCIARAYLCQEKAEAGWEEAALKLAEQATDKAPAWAYTWSERAKFEMRQNDVEPNEAEIEAALKDLDIAIECSNEAKAEAEYLARKPNLYGLLERSSDARKAAEECLKRYPKAEAYLWFWNGWRSSNEEDRKWALGKLEEGIKLAAEKQDRKTLAALQRALAHDRKTRRVELREAVRGYVSALEYDWLESDRPNIFFDLAEVLRVLGLFQEADRAIEEGKKIGGEEFRIQNVLGLLHWSRGQRPEAVEAFQNSLTERKDGDYYINVSNLIQALHGSGKSEEALGRAKEVAEKALPKQRVQILVDQARILADLSAPNLSSPGAASQRAEMLNALDQAEKLLRPAGAKLKPSRDLVVAALLRRDVPAARRELAAMREKWPTETHSRSIHDATLCAIEGLADPAQREMALARLAQTLATGWYYGFAIETFAEYRPLRDLPEWPRLVEALKIGSLDELRDRELRLAEWIEHIEAKSEPAKVILRQAAEDCRRRAEADRAKPLVIDWKKLLEPKKSER